MKTFKLIVFFSTVVFSIILFKTDIKAQWVQSQTCAPDYHDIASSQVLDPSAFHVPQYIIDQHVCSLVPNLELWGSGIMENTLEYCLPGTIIARDSATAKVDDYISKCCPFTPGHEFPNSSLVADFCCPSGTAAVPGLPNGCRDSNGNFIIDGEDAPEAIKFLTNEVANDDVGLLRQAKVRLSCDPLGCLINGVNILSEENTTIGNPLLPEEITNQGLTCIKKGFSLAGFVYENGSPIEQNFVCVAQSAVDESVLEIIESNLGDLSCVELDDDVEKERCFNCLKKNTDAINAGEPQSFVYSSIGCVDTRQGQFITRLFQIGLGLISGLAVIRIMWGAILRQSTDPAKIQEGWEMILAAGLALIAVVAAIPLLRFLGINLLDIFPGGFLG